MGKTTTLGELEKRGFDIVPEAARQIIAEEQQKVQGILPWTDLMGFQQKVLDRQLDLEGHVRGSVAFLDRGVVDGLAYCKLGAQVPHRELVRCAGMHRYEGVFILDQLPLYSTDTERKEDRETATKIHACLHEVYHEQGYRPIVVPVLKPEGRAQFILEHILNKSSSF